MKHNAKLKTRDGVVFGYARLLGSTLSMVRLIQTMAHYLTDPNGFDVYDSIDRDFEFIKTEKVRKVFKQDMGVYTFSRRIL